MISPAGLDGWTFRLSWLQARRKLQREKKNQTKNITIFLSAVEIVFQKQYLGLGAYLPFQVKYSFIIAPDPNIFLILT